MFEWTVNGIQGFIRQLMARKLEEEMISNSGSIVFLKGKKSKFGYKSSTFSRVTCDSNDHHAYSS